MERKYSKRWVDSKTNYDDWDDDDDYDYSDEEEQQAPVPPLPINILSNYGISQATEKGTPESSGNNSVSAANEDFEDEDIYQEEAPELMKGYIAPAPKEATEVSKHVLEASAKYSQPKEGSSSVQPQKGASSGQPHASHDATEKTVPLPKIRISSDSFENSSPNASFSTNFDGTSSGTQVQTTQKNDFKKHLPISEPVDIPVAHIDTGAIEKQSQSVSSKPVQGVEMHLPESSSKIQETASPEHEKLPNTKQMKDLPESSHISKLQKSVNDTNKLANPESTNSPEILSGSNIAGSTMPPVSTEKGFQSIYDSYEFANEISDVDSIDEQQFPLTGEVPSKSYSHSHETEEEYQIPSNTVENHIASDAVVDEESFNPYDIAKNHSENAFNNSRHEVLENSVQFSPTQNHGDLSYEESIEDSIENSYEPSVKSSLIDNKIESSAVEGTSSFVEQNSQKDDKNNQSFSTEANIKKDSSDNDSDLFSPLNINPQHKSKLHTVTSEPLSIDSKRPTSSHDLDKNFDDLFEDFENLSFGKGNQFTNTNFLASSENSNVNPLAANKFSLSTNETSKGMNDVTGGLNEGAKSSIIVAQSSDHDKMILSDRARSEEAAQFSSNKAAVDDISVRESRKVSDSASVGNAVSSVGVTPFVVNSGTQQTNELRKQSIGSYGMILDDDTDSDSDSNNEFRGSVSMGAWGNKDTIDLYDDKSGTESIELNVEKSSDIANFNQAQLPSIYSENQSTKVMVGIPTESSIENLSIVPNIDANSQSNLQSNEPVLNVESNEPLDNEEYSFNDSNADTSADVFGSSLHSASDHNSVDFRSSIYRNEFVQKTGAIHNSDAFDSSKINPSALREVSKYQANNAFPELPNEDLTKPVTADQDTKLSSAKSQNSANASPEIVPSFARSDTSNSLEAARNSFRNSRILSRTSSGLSRRSSTKSVGMASTNRVNSIIEVSSSDEEPDEISVSNGIWGSNAHADSLYKVSEDIEKEFKSLDSDSAAVMKDTSVEKIKENTNDQQMRDGSSLPSKNSGHRVSELLSLNTNLDFSDKVSTQDSFAMSSSNVPNTPIAKSISEFNNSPSTPTNDQIPPTPKKDAKYDSASKDFSPAVPPKDNDFTPTKFAPVKHNIPQLLNNSTDQVHDMLRKVRTDEYRHETGLHIWLEATLKSSSLNTSSATLLGPIAKASFDEAAAKKQSHVRTGEPQRRMSLNSKLNVSGRRFLLGTKNVNRNVKEKLEGGFARGLFKRNK